MAVDWVCEMAWHNISLVPRAEDDTSTTVVSLTMKEIAIDPNWLEDEPRRTRADQRRTRVLKCKDVDEILSQCQI